MNQETLEHLTAIINSEEGGVPSSRNAEIICKALRIKLQNNECDEEDYQRILMMIRKIAGYVPHYDELITVVCVKNLADKTDPNIDLLMLMEKYLDTINLISEISTEGKSEWVGSFLKLYLDRILQENKTEFRHRLEVLRSLNTLLEDADCNLKAKLVKTKEIISRLKQMSVLIEEVGDYEFQISIVECMLRMIPKTLREMVTPKIFTDQYKLTEFKKIRDLEFELDCRLYLNALNSSSQSRNRVISIPCYKVWLGDKRLNKPDDPNYTTFWVDFNMGSERLTIFHCSPNNADTQSSNGNFWQNLTVWKDDVQSCNVKKVQNIKIVNILLSQMVSDIYPSQQDVSGRSVRLHVDISCNVENALEKVFGSDQTAPKVSSVSTPLVIQKGDEQDITEDEDCIPSTPVKLPSGKKASVPVLPMFSMRSPCLSVSSKVSEPIAAVRINVSNKLSPRGNHDVDEKQTAKTKTPDAKEKIKTRDPKEKIKTPDPKEKIKTPGAKEITKTLDAETKSKTPNAKGKIKTPDSKGKIKTPDAKGKTKTPVAKAKSKTSDAIGKIKTPDSKTKTKTPVVTVTPSHKTKEKNIPTSVSKQDCPSENDDTMATQKQQQPKSNICYDKQAANKDVTLQRKDEYVNMIQDSCSDISSNKKDSDDINSKCNMKKTDPNKKSHNFDEKKENSSTETLKEVANKYITSLYDRTNTPSAKSYKSSDPLLSENSTIMTGICDRRQNSVEKESSDCETSVEVKTINTDKKDDDFQILESFPKGRTKSAEKRKKKKDSKNVEKSCSSLQESKETKINANTEKNKNNDINQSKAMCNKSPEKEKDSECESVKNTKKNISKKREKKKNAGKENNDVTIQDTAAAVESSIQKRRSHKKHEDGSRNLEAGEHEVEHVNSQMDGIQEHKVEHVNRRVHGSPELETDEHKDECVNPQIDGSCEQEAKEQDFEQGDPQVDDSCELDSFVVIPSSLTPETLNKDHFEEIDVNLETKGYDREKKSKKHLKQSKKDKKKDKEDKTGTTNKREFVNMDSLPKGSIDFMDHTDSDVRTENIKEGAEINKHKQKDTNSNESDVLEIVEEKKRMSANLNNVKSGVTQGNDIKKSGRKSDKMSKIGTYSLRKRNKEKLMEAYKLSDIDDEVENSQSSSDDMLSERLQVAQLPNVCKKSSKHRTDLEAKQYESTEGKHNYTMIQNRKFFHSNSRLKQFKNSKKTNAPDTMHQVDSTCFGFNCSEKTAHQNKSETSKKSFLLFMSYSQSGTVLPCEKGDAGSDPYDFDSEFNDENLNGTQGRNIYNTALVKSKQSSQQTSHKKDKKKNAKSTNDFPLFTYDNDIIDKKTSKKTVTNIDYDLSDGDINDSQNDIKTFKKKPLKGKKTVNSPSAKERQSKKVLKSKSMKQSKENNRILTLEHISQQITDEYGDSEKLGNKKTKRKNRSVETSNTNDLESQADFEPDRNAETYTELPTDAIEVLSDTQSGISDDVNEEIGDSEYMPAIGSKEKKKSGEQKKNKKRQSEMSSEINEGIDDSEYMPTVSSKEKKKSGEQKKNKKRQSEMSSEINEGIDDSEYMPTVSSKEKKKSGEQKKNKKRQSEMSSEINEGIDDSEYMPTVSSKEKKKSGEQKKNKKRQSEMSSEINEGIDDSEYMPTVSSKEKKKSGEQKKNKKRQSEMSSEINEGIDESEYLSAVPSKEKKKSDDQKKIKKRQSEICTEIYEEIDDSEYLPAVQKKTKKRNKEKVSDKKLHSETAVDNETDLLTTENGNSILENFSNICKKIVCDNEDDEAASKDDAVNDKEYNKSIEKSKIQNNQGSVSSKHWKTPTTPAALKKLYKSLDISFVKTPKTPASVYNEDELGNISEFDSQKFLLSENEDAEENEGFEENSDIQSIKNCSSQVSLSTKNKKRKKDTTQAKQLSVSPCTAIDQMVSRSLGSYVDLEDDQSIEEASTASYKDLACKSKTGKRQITEEKAHDRGFISGPSTSVRPSKSSLKRKYSDVVDSEEEEDYKPYQPRTLFKEQTFLIEEEHCLFNETDRGHDNLQIGVENPEMTTLLKAFGLDVQRHMQEKNHHLESLTKAALKSSQKEIISAFNTSKNKRCKILEKHQCNMAKELISLEKDISALKEAEQNSLTFYKQQMIFLQKYRIDQEKRLANLRNAQQELQSEMDHEEDQASQQHYVVQEKMKNNLLTMQKKMLLESQKEELNHVKRNLQTLFF